LIPGTFRVIDTISSVPTPTPAILAGKSQMVEKSADAI
jgi:hypothetical protein